MKKQGVTKRTRDRNVRRFSDKSVHAWKCLNKFADDHYKKKCERERFVDELCEVVDRYINLNCEILLWCNKNGVDPCDFVCDVENNSFYEK